MPFPNFQGRTRLWTRERVLEGMKIAAAAIEGQLPCCDSTYAVVKKGHYDWPPASRVLEFFHSMARGWLAAGAPLSRIRVNNIPWTSDELDYLLDNAGILTLATIARHLGRTYGACRGQLRAMKTGRARDIPGFLSAAQVAQEYRCSFSRVTRLLRNGTIKGKYDAIRNRWQVDPQHITKEVVALLKEPRRSHKTWPVDQGDYYARYRIRRTRVNGKTIRVEVNHAPVS